MQYVRRCASDAVAVCAVVMMLAVMQSIGSLSVADEAAEPVENEYAAMSDVVVSIAQKLEGKDRTDVLIALAQLQIVATHSTDDIRATMRNIESRNERITALRRLAFLSIEIGESDFAAEIVGLLTEEDKTQSTFAGSLALFMLQQKLMERDALADSAVLLLNKIENPFENEKQTFVVIMRLLDEKKFELAVQLMSGIQNTELQDALRYKLLSYLGNGGYADFDTFKEALDFVEKTLPLFNTQTKRAWGMFTVLDMFNDKDVMIWIGKIHQYAKGIEEDEYRSVLLRMVANYFVDKIYDSRAAMSFVTILEDAEKSARKVEPLARRLEILTFIAGVYGKASMTKFEFEFDVKPKHLQTKFEALIRDVKESIKVLPIETLSNAQRIVLLQEIAQAKRKKAKIGYVLGEHIEAVKLAANEPNGAELITEILLRIINLYKQNYPNSTKNSDEDQLRLPFEQYEREYFTPFKTPEDCGC